MPVHLYGHPAAMDRLGALAERHGLALVEDAAQAHAASLNGTPTGAFGTAGCFSFYPTKNMHALEGGMVTTADAALARRIRLLRNQGMEQRYANEIVGANLRMTDVSAAIGRVQLGRLPEWTERRRTNAKALDAGLTTLVAPPVAPGAAHAYHQYTVRVPAGIGRDEAQRALAAAGVGSAVYYPTPIHRLTPYATEGPSSTRSWDLPETERAATEVLSLPVHPSVGDAELDRIIAACDALGTGR
jgi:dTDP-4-amino-4,6-dideoxygalactose transaminase